MDKIRVKTRRYFTILEMLVVIALLALVGGLVSIGINRALANQKFKSEVSLVLDQLRLAQDLMLIMGTDVRLVFTCDEKDKTKGLCHNLELETKISPEIEREIFRKHKHLKEIIGIHFKDPESKEGRIVFKFQSRGAVMSSGLIELTTSPTENNFSPGILHSYICLPGYPRHIYIEEDRNKAIDKCKADLESVNDPALTQDTFSKITELLKPEEGSEGQAAEKKLNDSLENKKSSSKKTTPDNTSATK